MELSNVFQIPQLLAFRVEEAIQDRTKREWPIFLLMGQRALLMQVAHPLVAEAVYDHSSYREQPLQRMAHTFDLSMKLFVGNEAQARSAAATINHKHKNVQGQRYDARDPQLGKWVWATLVDGTLVGHELFAGPLTAGEKQTIIDTSRRRVALLGVREDLPGTAQDVRQYIDQMIDSGEVRVTAEAREIAASILVSTNPWLQPITGYLARATLPEALRAQYGLRWSLRSEMTFSLVLCPLVNQFLSRMTPEMTCLQDTK